MAQDHKFLAELIHRFGLARRTKEEISCGETDTALLPVPHGRSGLPRPTITPACTITGARYVLVVVGYFPAPRWETKGFQFGYI